MASSSSTPSSLWDTLPQEIKDGIFSFCDPLTLHLNERLPLSGENQQTDRHNAKEIWIAACETGWTGDLKTLPTIGFPRQLDDLSKVTSRGFYERLRQHRPDLDFQVPGAAKDLIDIYVKNDISYGLIGFEVDRPIPIKLRDDDDDIKASGSAECGPESTIITINGVLSQKIQAVFESALVNIPLRMCWMDLIEPYIRENPIMMAIFAITMNHFQLLKTIVEDIKLVDMADISRSHAAVNGIIDPYLEAAHYNNLEMIKFLVKYEYPISVHYLVLEKAMVRGSIDILHYIESDLLNQGFDRCIVDVNTYTINMDVWEWHWEFCSKSGKQSRLVPLPKDEISINRVINKLGNTRHPVHLMTLVAAAKRGNVNHFQKLWDYQIQSRNPTVWTHYRHNIKIDTASNTNMETIMAPFINVFQPAFMFNFPTPNASRILHQSGIRPNCRYDMFRSLFSYSQHYDTTMIECIRALHNVCKCPYTFISLLFELYFNCHVGIDMDVIKYLYRHCLPTHTSNALRAAAGSGNLEVVKYMCEGESVETRWDLSEIDLTYALQGATGGNLAIVKYLYDVQGVVYPDDLTIWIARYGSVDTMKYVVDNMPEAVFTTEVMDVAAGMGNLNMVRFLFENRKEGCSKMAVEKALEGQFLNNGFAIVRFLVETYPGFFDLEEVVRKFSGDVVIKKFLEELIACTSRA
ncbi:hypothetical protein HDU76_012568 [Blyttiomyces sp. JEL0837]|nr:hypothetical protein HDU76_012568 [Blyttiomyces sp. JEL0837]